MNNLQEKINNILEQLTKLLLDNIIADDIDEEEGQEIAKYILEEKRKVVDEVSFNQFLKNVSDQYPIFSSIIDNFQKQNKTSVADQQRLQEIKSQLSKFITN